MGNKGQKSTYNPYNLPINIYNSYIKICFDESIDGYEELLHFLYFNVNILRHEHTNLKIKKKYYYYYTITVLVTVLEQYFNTIINPTTGDPWINLVTEMQQLTGIFGNNHHPETA